MKTKRNNTKTEQNSILPSFFKRLFWSYDFSLIDPQEDKRIMIVNTVNYGKWEHWVWIFKFYGKEKLKKIIREIPETEFRKPALKLICLLLGIKKLKYVSRSDYIKSKKNS